MIYDQLSLWMINTVIKNCFKFLEYMLNIHFAESRNVIINIDF